MDNILAQPRNRNELMQEARNRAREESLRRWPPGMKYERQRQMEEDDLALKYFRQYMGETP